MGISSIEIRTDSQFMINCMTNWIQNWKRNRWLTKNHEPVKNRAELERLDEQAQNLRIKWTHVRGHVGEHGNEQADMLAKQGAEKSRRLL